MPAIFSKLWMPLATSYGLQIAAACVFVPLRSDKFYDLTGALGHLTCAGTSLYGPSLYRHLLVRRKEGGGGLSSYRPPPLAVRKPRLYHDTFLTFTGVCS